MEARRLRTPARPRRRLWCRALKGDERGSVSAELVLAAPLLLVLIMGVVQFAHCHDHHRRSHRSRDKRLRLVLTAGQGSRVRADRGLRCPGSSAMTLPGRLKREETGSVVAELVLLTPLLILVLLFVVALGRLAGARIDVDGAAAQAARAASIARDPATATAMAQQTATAALGSDNVTCAQLSVSTDTAQFQPGGLVAVTVTCTVSLSDLTGLRLPASESISSRFVEVVDTYRSAT